MAYNTKSIITDIDDNPISQYYNPTTDTYEPVEGSSGANKVILYNEDGSQHNTLPLVSISDKLTQLTGSVIDEETRKTNEIVRETSETSRVSSESTRVSNEVSRKSNETARGIAEISRVDAENLRVIEESTRVSNENARVDSEQTRLDTEGTRVNNENTRISSEISRESSEGSRSTNESIRMNSEDARISSEDIRNSNESDRTENESIRVSNELDRVSNETYRQLMIEELRIWENYNHYKTYKPLNKVLHNGSSYICIMETVGNLPTNNNYWMLIASKGSNGDGAGDMVMSVYDSNEDGVVDFAESALTVNGKTLGEDVPIGAKFTDTIYEHPTTSGNKHIPSNGSSNQILRYSASGTAVWSNENNTTYNIATTSVNGLLSSTDKVKINGITDGASKTENSATNGNIKINGAEQVIYTHPSAHSPSIISQDASNRFVTDTEKATWNGKSNFSGSYTDLTNKPTIPDTSVLMPKSGGVLENYREKLVALSGTSTSINLSLGNIFTHTLTGNTTYSITNVVSGQAHSFTLIITQTATARTITFPASVKWQGGEIPDLSTASKTYVLTFMTINGGTTWLGMFGGEF